MRMAGKSRITADHEEIVKWAEERGGKPARVEGTGSSGDVGILRIDFGDKEPNLEPITWDQFFAEFEKKNLAFLYQEKTADGEESRFFKLIDRGDANGTAEEEETDEDDDLLDDMDDEENAEE